MRSFRAFIANFARFWAVGYVLLFVATSQFSVVPGFFERFIGWFGTSVVGVEDAAKVRMTGSGDTAYDYVVVAFNLSFSFLLGVLGAAIIRRREKAIGAYRSTIVIARYYVAATMLIYGFAKVFEGQFGAPDYFRLEQRLGDMSPMGLVWTFMGVSRPYTVVSGVLECFGGLLLYWRGTKALGALLSMAIMLNVAFLNYFYDVPVKLFSTNIILLCLFILSYDFKPLYRFFILHRAVHLPSGRFTSRRRWVFITSRILKYAFVFGLVVWSCAGLWPTLNKNPVTMEGAYLIDTFVLDGDTIRTGPRHAADASIWKKAFISYNGHLAYLDNADGRKHLTTQTDTVSSTITLNRQNANVGTLHYTQRKDSVFFEGTVDGRKIAFSSLRKQRKDYPLVSRGFHWVNKYPPNW